MADGNIVIETSLDTSGIEAGLNQMRRALGGFGDAKVTFSFDDAEGTRKISALQKQVATLDDTDADVEASADTSEAEEALNRVSDQADAINGQSPHIEASADTSDAEASLKQVEETAKAVDGTDPKVDVNVDTHGAASALSTLRDSINGWSQEYRNGTDQASAGLENMRAVAGKLGGVLAGVFSVGKVIEFGKAAADAFSKYQQLVGGVDTIFKDSSKRVQRYADNAYKTAGMSANQYMENITGFSASLLQALHGNTKAAAKVGDMAVKDMADRHQIVRSKHIELYQRCAA